jgi:hypothetical protein
MRSLPPLCRRTLREKASAYRSSLRAIQATAEESRLPGQTRSRAGRHSSTARRARNVPPGVSRSHQRHFHRWQYVDRNRGEIGITCRLPAIRKMPHSSGSRILGEDLGPWRSSLSLRTVLPRFEALRTVVIPIGYSEGEQATSSFSNFAISFSSQMANASSISCSVPPRYSCSNVSPWDVRGM